LVVEERGYCYGCLCDGTSRLEWFGLLFKHHLPLMRKAWGV
jgi:hypothetical protein